MEFYTCKPKPGQKRVTKQNETKHVVCVVTDDFAGHPVSSVLRESATPSLSALYRKPELGWVAVSLVTLELWDCIYN